MGENKSTFAVHGLLVILEIIAVIHDVSVFGAGMFRFYTIDSNLLQLLVSVCILYYLFRGKKSPVWLLVLHLICAVCLTVTFLIAAFVLAPQEGFAYYFLSNVAPINHFLGPLLSVASFIFTQTKLPLPIRVVFAPAAASLLYGIIALILNLTRVLDGPYFFLRIYEVPLKTVIIWFLIIAFLCLVLSALYVWLRGLVRSERSKRQGPG